MRLVAWNCNGALHRKLAALLSLRPDMAIVPECARPEILITRRKASLRPKQCAWVGEQPNKGLGVFAFGAYSLEPASPFDPPLRWILPIRVSGPHSFHLLAVWSFENRGAPLRRRLRSPVVEALRRYRTRDRRGSLVVAGDFNNHIRWDRPGSLSNHAVTVEALGRLGLASAYHHHRDVPQGGEREPTHYWRDRTKDGPTYHIDYVFVPEGWLPRLRAVEVGGFEEWCGAGLSDHVPILVELDL